MGLSSSSSLNADLVVLGWFCTTALAPPTYTRVVLLWVLARTLKNSLHGNPVADSVGPEDLVDPGVPSASAVLGMVVLSLVNSKRIWISRPASHYADLADPEEASVDPGPSAAQDTVVLKLVNSRTSLTLKPANHVAHSVDPGILANSRRTLTSRPASHCAVSVDRGEAADPNGPSAVLGIVVLSLVNSRRISISRPASHYADLVDPEEVSVDPGPLAAQDTVVLKLVNLRTSLTLKPASLGFQELN